METIKPSMEEAAGYVEEETGEMLKNQRMARKGRALRNKGRVRKGKAPKLTEPGKGNKND